MLKRLWRNRKGMTVADILLIIVLGVAIVIGAMIVGYLQSTVSNLPGISPEANQTIQQAFANVITSLNLATIGIIVFAAMAILSVVLLFLGGGGRGRRR